MRITLLAQGSTSKERAREHWGVAFLLGREILFDTFGDAHVLLKNIKKYKINLAHIKHIVISHDHWDHTNGLWSVLPCCPLASVYVCQRVSSVLKKKILSFGAKLIEVKREARIVSGVYTTGQLKGRLGKSILYEQSLVLPSARGLVLLTGCSHPGVDRIVSYAVKKFQQAPFWVVGGFHLKDDLPATVTRIAQNMLSSGVKRVSPLHCTGSVAAGIFKKTFGPQCISWTPGASKIIE